MTRRTGPSERVRQEVYTRAGNACERCGRTTGSFSIHHRRPRGMGGTRRPETNDPVALLLLCGSGTSGCHGWVESHREESLRLGYLVRQGVDPASVQVVPACSPWRESCTDQTPCSWCPVRVA